MLAPKQFDLLVALAASQGEVLSPGDILEEVWGYRHEVVSRRPAADPPRPPHRLSPGDGEWRPGAHA